MRGREIPNGGGGEIINLYFILIHLNVVRYFEMFKVKMKDK